MKWLGVTGSWKYELPELKSDIQCEVNKYLDDGYGIISGGAAGVDYWATQTVLERFPDGSRTRIIIPTRLDVLIECNYDTKDEPGVDVERAKLLTKQLRELESVGSLIVNMPELEEVTQESFSRRNDRVVEECDELIAFQVNNSRGVQYTINQAKSKGKSVHHFTYMTDGK